MFCTKKNIKCCFAKKKKKKKKGLWSTNPFFSGLRMHFYRLPYWIWSDACQFHLKYILLGFLTFIINFSSFHNGLKHLCSSLKLVSILRVTLSKVIMKCGIVILFKFSDYSPKNFHFWGCKILSHQVSNIQST